MSRLEVRELLRIIINEFSDNNYRYYLNKLLDFQQRKSRATDLRSLTHKHTLSLSLSLSLSLLDFGFSRTVTNQDVKTPCGSYSYAAPELFISRGSCYDGKKADIWSL